MSNKSSLHDSKAKAEACGIASGNKYTVYEKRDPNKVAAWAYDADTYAQKVYQLKQRLKDEVKAAFEEGFLAGVEDGWINNPRIDKEWKKSKARTSLEK